jgi:preprotein translocase subunit SecE
MVENKSKYLNALSWLAIVLLSAFSCIVYLKYLKVATALKLAFWLVWLVVTLGFLAFTNLGGKMWQYIIESKDEMKKVHWPSRNETVQTTLIIAAFVFVISIVLWLVDTSMLWMVAKLTHLYK